MSSSKFLFSVLSLFILALGAQSSEKISNRETKSKSGKAGESKNDFMKKKGAHRESSLRGMMEKLNLNEKQREKVKILMREMMSKQKAISENIKTLMKTMEEIRSSENVNQEAMIRIGSELGGLKTKLGLCMHNFFNNLKQHLNEEQLIALASIQEELKQRRNQHHGKGRRGEAKERERGEYKGKMHKRKRPNENED